MEVILFLQTFEPRSVLRLVFATISWCGDGPLYLLLFPLLYWGKAPSVAVRYGYLWGWAVLVMTVLKGLTPTLRPFLSAPEQVALLQPLLAGFYWFPNQESLIAAYRHSPAFPSGHTLCATAMGLYLWRQTTSVGWRCLLGFFLITIPLARLYLGVHYPIDVLAGSAVGGLLWGVAASGRWTVFAQSVECWGLPRWLRHLLLALTLMGGLALVSTQAVVVGLILLSYPLLLTVAQRPMATFTTNHDMAWRTANAVGGCLGVGGLLIATAPLRGLSLLVSVPLMVAWVTLGCPSLLRCLCSLLRHLVQWTGTSTWHPGGDQPT